MEKIRMGLAVINTLLLATIVFLIVTTVNVPAAVKQVADPLKPPVNIRGAVSYAGTLRSGRATPAHTHLPTALPG